MVVSSCHEPLTLPSPSFFLWFLCQTNSWPGHTFFILLVQLPWTIKSWKAKVVLSYFYFPSVILLFFFERRHINSWCNINSRQSLLEYRFTGTDGKTYKSVCRLNKKRCQTEDPLLGIAHYGHCAVAKGKKKARLNDRQTFLLFSQFVERKCMTASGSDNKKEEKFFSEIKNDVSGKVNVAQWSQNDKPWVSDGLTLDGL